MLIVDGEKHTVQVTMEELAEYSVPLEDIFKDGFELVFSEKEAKSRVKVIRDGGPRY